MMCRISDANSKWHSPAAQVTHAAWSRCTISACWPRRARSMAKYSRGFTVFVGGGLGTVPQQAKVLGRFRQRRAAIASVDTGGITCLCPARRKEESQPRADKIPGEQARHRRIPPAWCKKNSKPCRTTTATPPISTRCRISPMQPAKAGMSLNGTPMPEGFPDWYQTNVYHQAQSGYSAITLASAAGRFHGATGFPTGGYRSALCRRQYQIVSGAEYRAALGSRRRSSRHLPRIARDWHGRCRSRYDRRYHRLPGHGYLQAGHRFLARLDR